MVNWHISRCSTSLIISETQIKITMRRPLTPVRMAITIKTTNNTRWRGCGTENTLLHHWWERELVQTIRKTTDLRNGGFSN